jgi:hypothetical protein
MAKNNWKKLKEQAEEYMRIGNIGVELAIKETFEMGLPIVFGKEDKIYWKYPDGYITTISPFKKIKGEQHLTADALRRQKKYLESKKSHS